MNKRPARNQVEGSGVIGFEKKSHDRRGGEDVLAPA
jgi:hypothetical protein